MVFFLINYRYKPSISPIASEFILIYLLNYIKNKGIFWIGHATHILQDSFSKAHTLRRAPSFKEIDDICTYGMEFESICFHKNYEDLMHGDRVWNTEKIAIQKLAKE